MRAAGAGCSLEKYLFCLTAICSTSTVARTTGDMKRILNNIRNYQGWEVEVMVTRTKENNVLSVFSFLSIICSGYILETGKCWQAHCSLIGWYFVYTNCQPIGEYMRVGLVWPCTTNYTIDRPLQQNCCILEKKKHRRAHYIYSLKFS